MKQVSIQALKANLSSAIAEAEAGATLLITRHSDHVAQLGPIRQLGVRRGGRVTRGRLESAVKGGTRGRYLALLLEDRDGR